MPSIRRTLLPGNQHNYDRPLSLPLSIDMKDIAQIGNASPRPSSSPLCRLSSPLFSLSAALRCRCLTGLEIFLPKSYYRKRWPQPFSWSYVKSSLIHFFFFFLLGFLLGFSPFFDLDLESSQSSLTPSTTYHHPFFRSEINSARRGFGTILLPRSAEELKEITTMSPMDSKLLIIVTPSYNRALQYYYLHRLSQTLRLVPPPLLWIVVEMGSASDETADVLRRTGVMYRHLVCQKNSLEVKDRGVHQRNIALEHIERHHIHGIVYFADDDNSYSIQLFSHLRDIRRFGTWPVAMLSQCKSSTTVEGPVCKGNQVVGWNTNEKSKRLRRFHVDMSGFAFNSTMIWDPKRWFPGASSSARQLDTIKEGFQVDPNEINYEVEELMTLCNFRADWSTLTLFVGRLGFGNNRNKGEKVKIQKCKAAQSKYMETTFIEQLVEDESQMEGLPNSCSNIMNWHLHLEARHLGYPKRWHVSLSLDAFVPLELER